MITESHARKIASEWHSGQWSALYAFSSSGTILQDLQSEIVSTIREARGLEIRDLEELLRFVKARGVPINLDKFNDDISMLLDLRSEGGMTTQEFEAAMQDIEDEYGVHDNK